MIKLLIVEDELNTRRGLMRHIPWKKIGVDMVETAESADEAFGICAGGSRISCFRTLR